MSDRTVVSNRPSLSDGATSQFVDTNVLVYAHDSSAGSKHKQAQNVLRNLWESEQGCLSIQVLQEFYVTVTRKVARPLSPEQASQVIVNLGAWQVHSPSVTDIQEAIAIQTRYNLSFWDAMIIQSAVRLGCDTLWSEDLNTGQRYAGVEVINPFE